VTWISEVLTKHPELAVYLALGIGFWIGSIKFGKFSLGGVTGPLLFDIGYEVGPKFFGAEARFSRASAA
jgi:hypothetical protein